MSDTERGIPCRRNSRTLCPRLSISWTINKNKNARHCLFVGHVALQRLRFTSRQSVKKPLPAIVIPVTDQLKWTGVSP